MKTLVILVLVCAALFVAPAASAGSWQYYGWLPNGYDANCIWYAGSAQCSGWNYWKFNQDQVYSGGPVLVGFENYSTIRGRWTYPGDAATVWPSLLGMPAYVKAQITNYSGVTAWLYAGAGA
jgi:hypothetical protein